MCGRHDQLPVVTHVLISLLHGDALRAHHIFQEDVPNLTGVAGKVKRLRQLMDGSMYGRVVDGWKVALQQAPPQVVAVRRPLRPCWRPWAF
eukprot:COSAG01_NODE_4775_length_4751_cov_3.519132_2_plen_91_part_00